MRLSPPPLPAFLAAELPFERGLLELGRGRNAGLRMHFVDHGPADARPVLLQHGNPTWCYLWRRVIAGLGDYRAIAPDLLGFGLSDSLPGIAEHTLERHADALVELVETLDLSGLVLVGQDWGGPLVAALGARCPGRVAGLVLANTAVLVPARPRGATFHRLSRLPVVSDLLFRAGGFPQNVLGRVQADPATISGATARAYRWPLRGWRRRAAPLALARMVPDSSDHPSIPVLAEGERWARAFAGPAALVWGERDPILGRALGRHREALPRARVVETGAGHFLQEEVPEVLAEAIEAVARAAAPRS